MKPEVYKRFAEYMLSDLAERRTQTGTKLRRGQRRRERLSGNWRPLALYGDHIYYLTNGRFRGSDCSFRLSMAVRAYEKAFELEHNTVRGANWSACVAVTGLILASPSCQKIRGRFLKGGRGPRPQTRQAVEHSESVRRAAKSSLLQYEDHDPRLDELTRIIIREPRRQTAGKPKLLPDVRRLTRVIRSQVYQFRKQHADYAQLFDMWLVAFRDEFVRDADWYAEAEPEYRWRVRTTEEQLGPSHMLTASHTLNLARLLHEQGKFEEAVPVYQLTLERWSSLPPEVGCRRQTAMALIEREIERCRNRQEPSTEYPELHLPVLSNPP